MHPYWLFAPAIILALVALALAQSMRLELHSHMLRWRSREAVIATAIVVACTLAAAICAAPALKHAWTLGSAV